MPLSMLGFGRGAGAMFVAQSGMGPGYSVHERRDSDLCTTVLCVKWTDGCSMTYRLTDEVRAACRGNLARDEVVRTMNEQHEFSHTQSHEQPCGTRHLDGVCPLCDVLKAQRYVRGQTGIVVDHALVVPEWVAEWERKWKASQEQKWDAYQEQRAASSIRPATRRYCPAEE